jgi:tetraacyldisaccharide 4'-kinase
MKILKPKFWDQDYYTFFSLFLLPISFFYQILISLKKLITIKKKFPIPIICVGNIYIGGTGKTPLAIKIFEILKELNKNPVIIKKNYKNHEDEISLIKNYSKILTSKKRVDAINSAVEKKFDCAVLDDGYQDFEIKKNLNIICFNIDQKIGNGYTIPSGPLRQNLRSLKECNLILINGKKDVEFEQKLLKYNSKLIFFYYNYYARSLLDLKNKKLIAFAGIGNPKNFFNFLKLNQLNIVKEISYPDHYQYTEKELNYLTELEKKYTAKLITTEKDSFRINPFFRKRFIAIPIEVKFQDEKNFKDTIEKFIK